MLENKYIHKYSVLLSKTATKGKVEFQFSFVDSSANYCATVQKRGCWFRGLFAEQIWLLPLTTDPVK